MFKFSNKPTVFFSLFLFSLVIIIMPYQMPRYAFHLSLLGVTVGAAALLKDYMGGSRHNGNEKIVGKTVIITGANTGIGKETARELAKRGGKIIMACRDMKRCEAAQKEIIETSFNRNVHCRLLDLSSLKSIREFAEQINKEEDHLEILINNAGVMRCPKMLTTDGFELQLGVNHLGHFLLTNLLLDKLKASAPARIINVSSLAHVRGTINFDDLNSEKAYSEGEAYNQSKLANILFTRELARKLKGTSVNVNALHPGVVDTELIRHMSVAKSSIIKAVFWPIKFFLFKTSEQGAQTSIHLAVDSSMDAITGKYFSDCREKEVVQQGQNDEDARRLWLISEKWTQLTK